MTTFDKEKIYNEINSFFNHVYVLTIERASERHSAINKELEGLKFTYYFGVDKKKLVIEDLENCGIYNAAQAIAVNRYGKPMKIGEIACSMGHKAIYEDIVKNKYTRALILEDDIVLNNNTRINFSTIVQQLPINWHVLYLDYFKNETTNTLSFFKKNLYHIQKKLGFLKWSHTTINNIFALPYSSNLKIAGYHDYASAYGITLEAANILIKHQTPIRYPSDHALGYLITSKLLNGFISFPKLFFQNSQKYKNTYGSLVEDFE